MAVVLGAAALAWRPNAAWIERAYANGVYPAWEHAAFLVTNPLPWSLGDVAGLLGAAAIVWRILAYARSRRRRGLHSFGMLLFDLAAIAGLYAIWFETSWGWNYARAPVEARVAFDAARVTPAAADRLRARAMDAMNALAAPAHARAAMPLDLVGLRDAWLPAVQRAGDAWSPQAGPAKPTIANPFMEATGTSGFINPLTLNTQLAGDVLWFERPFDQAHEWSHVAAYAREDEANYLAVDHLSALARSGDAILRLARTLPLLAAEDPLRSPRVRSARVARLSSDPPPRRAPRQRAARALDVAHV